jgi:uncharacterized protein (TIGR03000 family)
MYSAVLMLALTAGSDSVDFGRSRCHGCSSACTTTVVYAPACSTCSTRHGLFNRCHGCTTCTAYSCSSSCGGLFHRRHSCSCPPACTVVYSCATTVPVGPEMKKKEMPKGEKIDAPKDKKEASINVPATIVVSLPADARLIVDGTPTTSTSARRTLTTPVLENGSTYVYTMQAEITREGRVQTQTQQVTVRGGATSNVVFDFSTESVASR